MVTAIRYLLFSLTVCAFAMKPSMHYAIALKSAKDAGFSESAAKIIAIGATAPDKYDWETASAHGQTPNDSFGSPKVARNVAIQEFERYVQEKVSQVDLSLSGDKGAEALYRIGYIMHAMQDLSVHMGMTNFTHSRLAKEGKNPDIDPDRIALGALWSKELLEVSSRRWAARWQDLKKYDCSAPGSLDTALFTLLAPEGAPAWLGPGSGTQALR